MNDCNCCYGKWIAIFVGTIPILYFLRKYFQGGQFTKNVSANGKVIIVTGANTGIGKETALDLAGRGAKVYMACRDYNRCEEARQEIIKKTGNRNVFNFKLDLSSLDSVREFVKKFLAEETRLDILINNAGLMVKERSLTKDGFESTIGVNHFGHFLLTNLLLDTLKSSAPSQIINVSSFGHKFAKLNKDDLHSEKSYSSNSAYVQSKLANILFTRELAKRLKGTDVRANSLHPGAVNSEFGRNLPAIGKLIFGIFTIFMKTSKSGAQTTLAIALDPEFENVTGKYFRDCKIDKESKAAQDDEMAEWLWKISEESTKLKQD